MDDEQQIHGIGSSVDVGPEIEKFATILDECVSPSTHSNSNRRERILRIVNEYHNIASKKCTSIRNSIKHGSRSQSYITEDVDMDVGDDSDSAQPLADRKQILQRWEQECQIWDLLRRILPLRFCDKPTENPTISKKTTRERAKQAWRDFLELEPRAKERRAVLQWLQNNGSTRPEINQLVKDLQHNADRGDIVSHGWLHTRSSIKLRKSVLVSEGPLNVKDNRIAETHRTNTGEPLVTNLDPDVFTRQNRKLAKPDSYFENAIWLGCYEHIRRGSSIQDLRDWCADRTEMWRASSISALSINLLQDDITDEIDPEALTLWRRMCFALCRNGGNDDYERAVYGLLSGDFSSVEKICQSWDDLLFAHYNSILRAQFDTYLAKNCVAHSFATTLQSFPVFDAIQVQESTELQLMKLIEANPKAKDEASQPMKALQAAIIANDLESHFYNQGLSFSIHGNAGRPSRLLLGGGELNASIDSKRYVDLADHAGLRIMCHVFIILSLLKKTDPGFDGHSETGANSSQQVVQENLISAYVSLLRLAGLEELIPLYCSEMDEARAYEILSRNLNHITNSSTRLMQLNLIEKAGLDTVTFVQTQPSIIFDDINDPRVHLDVRPEFKIVKEQSISIQYGRMVKTDFFGDDPDAIDRADELLIRTLEWQLLVQDAWPVLLRSGVQIYKHFLDRGHLNAARHLFNRVSALDVVKARFPSSSQEELNVMIYDDSSIWLQKLGDELNISDDVAASLAADLRTFRELESIVQALDTMETLASLAQLSRESQPVGREFWSKVGSEVKLAKSRMQPILKGWLLGGIQDQDEDLHQLRDQYLPETVLAYISILHFAGTSLSRDNLLECMELAAIIADKESDIASCFMKCQRMVELVEAFASCSKALAVTNDGKTTSSSTKKLREMGWSRDIWSVK